MSQISAYHGRYKRISAPCVSRLPGVESSVGAALRDRGANMVGATGSLFGLPGAPTSFEIIREMAGEQGGLLALILFNLASVFIPGLNGLLRFCCDYHYVFLNK